MLILRTILDGVLQLQQFVVERHLHKVKAILRFKAEHGTIKLALARSIQEAKLRM